jgi:hypothetical protein
MSYDVFISYSREDSEFVKRLVEFVCQKYAVFLGS